MNKCEVKLHDWILAKFFFSFFMDPDRIAKNNLANTQARWPNGRGVAQEFKWGGKSVKMLFRC